MSYSGPSCAAVADDVVEVVSVAREHDLLSAQVEIAPGEIVTAGTDLSRRLLRA